ncbi:IS3 family transposase [Sediminispirochaeta smaragdinae]|uniref:Integrase catalytic region n=1 Tax=Sediminispirochaeta smaragdinae (strain DSM 11293 / JCM 15392 / SEBR 4228) TaxID=573413 RepID=E1R890_SEDSS|nr:IS3 family transposase [Sediminispirochaeta smaragdinae]ADK82945.1 Integrase catalytic region [Sediminispirochaeta smaragdinae DSM 11293]ADK83037.1 Integrase catalytic region [Sediminispirochaeta smaragdinae DSM 11293]
MFGYIRETKGRKRFSVVRMCKALKVSETGYYKWKRTGNKPKAWQLLLVKIHKILDEHPDNQNYGIKRILIALEQRGERVSRSTVIRAMRKGNLLHASPRRPEGVTKAEEKAQRPKNLLQRDFSATGPNEKWLTDITQIPCLDGTLYIAPIFDCFGGEIIALAMESTMKKELCIQAVKEAYRTRNPGSGVIIHSDAGSQYTSELYKKTLGGFHAVQSMSDVGKCYDNARMESFFATLKKEKLYQMNTMKRTREDVKTIVWRYVMVYYNRQRISTVNKGGLPPTMFRIQAAARQAAA